MISLERTGYRNKAEKFIFTKDFIGKNQWKKYSFCNTVNQYNEWENAKADEDMQESELCRFEIVQKVCTNCKIKIHWTKKPLWAI